jgi:Ribose/Galactose Isomerase/Glucosamine-6-phosphate isomerases/6-phosphogluconolactonase
MKIQVLTNADSVAKAAAKIMAAEARAAVAARWRFIMAVSGGRTPWQILAGKVDRGVAICGSGVGASICANKFRVFAPLRSTTISQRGKASKTIT